MKHLTVAVFVVACSAPAPKLEPKPVAKPAVPTVSKLVVATPHKPRAVIEAPHAGAIVELALSPDGTAALTADEQGGARLWPTFDGSQEPRVVALPVAKQLAVTRETDSFGVAVLDEVGGLYLAFLDATGRTVSHVTMSPDPPFVGFAMTELGLLAWRADQTLLLLDAQGGIRSQIATEPRERVITIAVAGKRAIALIEKDATTRVLRWLTLQPSLAWGATLKLDDPNRGDKLALSPHATRLAVIHNDTTARATSVQIIDIATGKTLSSAPVQATSELGFVDDDQLAIGTQQGVAWLDTKAGQAKAQLRPNDARLFRRSVAFATGAGRAVTSANGELQLVTPTKTEYLGYAVVAPRFVEAAPNGELLVGTRDSFTRLDAKLRATGSPIVLATNPTQFLSLGGNDWLVESVGASSKVELHVVDAANGAKTKVRDVKESNVMMYEPSSQLVTLSLGSLSEVTGFDAKTKQLDRLASVAKPSAYEQTLLVPLAPKLANGNSLLHIAMREGPTVKWLRDARALDKAASTVTIDGSYAAADAAGHVFLWRTTQAGKVELAVYLDGKSIAQLQSEGPTSLWPDRAGKTVALVGANTITLHTAADGKQLWAKELGAIQEAIWLDDGALAITSGGGIARLDPATGDITSARCGWSFGLAAAPHPPTSRVESLCAQLDR